MLFLARQPLSRLSDSRQRIVVGSVCVFACLFVCLCHASVSFIVTIATSRLAYEIKRDIGRKLQFFHTAFYGQQLGHTFALCFTIPRLLIQYDE